MAFWSRRTDTPADGPMLAVEGLDVYYGRAHALQGVGFSIERGVLATRYAVRWMHVLVPRNERIAG